MTDPTYDKELSEKFWQWCKDNCHTSIPIDVCIAIYNDEFKTNITWKNVVPF